MIKTKKFLATLALMLALPFVAFAEVTREVSDSIAFRLNETESCATCGYCTAEHSTSGMVNTIVVAVLVLLGGVWRYSNWKKIHILILSVLVAGLVAGSYFATPYLSGSTGKNAPENCLGAESEFRQADADEFSAPASDEFSPATTADDEFRQADADEFSATTSRSTAVNAHPRKINQTMIVEPAVIFLILGMIGYLIKYEWFRKTRAFFLIGSLIYLGFVRGACPCMISSFQNSVLMVFGVPVAWESLLWFLTLIPATYFFGKVWCGWLCHLGAFQEFIHRVSAVNFLSGRKAQKTLKIIQITVIIIWILQQLITRANIFCVYDPFKAAFNLLSPSWIDRTLLAALIVSSLLMHRPFCRTVCPVGLILGWISLLPGAKKLDKDESCINCKVCSNNCATRAMICENKTTTLKTEDCMMCGECMSCCKTKDALHVNRKRVKKGLSP